MNKSRSDKLKNKFKSDKLKKPKKIIFCKDCDCDFSIFGNEHVWSNPMHLKILDGPYKSSKEEAYALKSGNYVLS